jgi:hypothetical protein
MPKVPLPGRGTSAEDECTPADHQQGGNVIQNRPICGPGHFVRSLKSLLVCLFLCPCPLAEAGQLGANKVDLLFNYLPPPVAIPEGNVGYRFVRRAMAKKAILDARDAGLTFLRVSSTGYRPIDFDDKINDLSLWQSDPHTFWADADDMFDDLDRAGIRIVPTLAWNIIQFPALGGDDLYTFLRDPNSRSRTLFARFVTDFVTRYRNRQTILFYELSNEWNLDADIDLQGNCQAHMAKSCVWHNFSTDDLLEFSRWFVSLMKNLDPSRKVSSGYSLPRAAAWHLRSGDGWINDSIDEFEQYLVYLNEPFDIVSVHIYPPATDRFGASSGEPGAVISAASSAAKTVGKELFIGEFGDGGATPFVRNFLREILSQNIDYAAIWVWEFYQASTYETHNTEPSRYSIEPGYYDDLIGLIWETEQALGQRPVSRQLDPPRVILTWPLPCAEVDRETTLAAVASAGTRGVKSVAFFVNGDRLATVTSPPFYAKFDPKGFDNRNVEIEARAAADSGLSAVFKTTVRVNGSQASCQVPRD